ncbi:MAG: hypothetical protein JXB32_22730 [Deltaproteobacteria bacterium]|nr:hypothetical protein [Deltaproteobacteria bacterium]
MSPSNRTTVRPAGAALLAALAALGALDPAPAAADAQASFTYDHDILWSTAIRLLRVDLGYEISEQDRENGYLLFVVHANGREYQGAVEFVRGLGERGIAEVELSVRVVGLPSSSEEAILRKLRTKLREDYGLPPRAPAAQTPVPAPEEPPADAEPTTPPADESAGS